MGKITATRYLRNAKGILRTVPIEDDTYTDIKPVQEACSTAYLAILRAIDDYLLKKGIDEKDLPKSVDGYRKAIKKHLLIHNGNLVRQFEKLYKLLHIAGYYRGLLEDVNVLKDALKSAEKFIKKLNN
ncbi:MAG: CoA-binding protein [Candidatus Scalindua rubra]|uniref:CoA-binding protein n=1 Tax=Candidatus Scalindua rubra TaxID=1872076 RepID=A0A1E3XER7_9BACT|nr:MAG: CoA-binding protein [Candidatus Scalindua rubra]